MHERTTSKTVGSQTGPVQPSWADGQANDSISQPTRKTLRPGPRDGLMTGINKQTNLSFSLIRITIELSAVGLGFYLGGIVGIGTILYALGIGFSVSLGLFLVGKFYK